MSGIVKMEELNNLIIEIRGEKVLLDADVAMIYGVETKRINEAEKNNPDKYSPGIHVRAEWGGICIFAVESFDRKIRNDESCAQSLH